MLTLARVRDVSVCVADAITTISFSPNDHLFEDQIFKIGVPCSLCNKKVWMKTSRQCRDCSATVHKKCETLYAATYPCTGGSNARMEPTTASDSRRVSAETDTSRMSRLMDSDGASPRKQSLPARTSHRKSSQLANFAAATYSKLLDSRNQRSSTFSNSDSRKSRSSSGKPAILPSSSMSCLCRSSSK